MKLLRLLAILGFASLSHAYASFHLWQIVEVYSDASGTVQFIELETTSDGENLLSGRTLSSNAHTFTFPGNLPTNTANHHILLATPGYMALSGVPTADYSLGMNNFFATGGDTLNYANGINTLTFTMGELPLDGVNSLNRAFNPPTPTTFTTAEKSPMNFASGLAAAPKVVISGAKHVTTTKSKIAIRGKVTGSVTKVAYRVGNKGPNKVAIGTNPWHFTTALKKGDNIIGVTATGPGGKSKVAKVTVTRK